MPVVKVQVPLYSNDPRHVGGKRGLVYDEKRRYSVEQMLPEKVIKALGENPKGFFKAEFKNGTWVIGEPVGWRDW